MIVVRFFVNAMILAAELAAIAGAAWLGYAHPYLFTGLTAGLAFALGMQLDYARLRHEYPFYFEAERPRFFWGLRLLAVFDSLVKALAAGAVALLTFSGNDLDRRFWVAVAFAVAVFAGTSLLRRLWRSLGARPTRWGFFRLAVPLGLVFSSAMALITALGYVKTVTLGELMKQLVLETPARPQVEHVSDLLFGLKQYVDGIVATLLNTVLPLEWAQIVSLVISVNVLTGFAAALFAVVIAESVRRAEQLSP